MKLNVLCVGPVPPAITGQSVAFESYVKNTQNEVLIIDTNRTGRSAIGKFFNVFRALTRYFYALITCNFEALYITTSRTSLGFLLDSIFIVAFKIMKRGVVVNHLHGSDFIEFRRSYRMKNLIDFVYGMVDKSIVLSESMREQYEIYPDMRIYVVPNFSEDFMSETDLKVKLLSFDEEKINVLYLSNLMYSKGVVHLIEAISDINKKGNRFNLTLAGAFIGDKHMSAEEVKFAVESRLSESINYVGVVSGDDKRNLLSKSQVFCLPTFYETEAQPISVIEAASYCCSIILTNHNYNGDLLNFFDLDLIKPESKEHIVEALEDFYNMRSYYASTARNTYHKAIEFFTLDAYVGNIDFVIGGECESKHCNSNI